jgi:3',5'-cyclic AMP phosphodiesterase CpdA
MGFIQERILNIALGVSKEYHLFQFSDVHVVTYRPTDSAESIEKAINQEKTWMTQRLDFARKFHEPFDSEHLLPSTECLGNLIDYANQNNPDLVLLTGDIVDYYSEANHDFLKQSLMKIKSPYLFSIGNHESPSIRFEDLCQGKSDFAAFDLGEFFVVSIDDSKRRISAFQREAFARLLTLNKPIIIACHVPMVTRHNEAVFPKFDSYFTMSYQDCDEITGDFIDLVCSSDQVKAVLCGHIHGAMASFIAPDKPQYCCSSGLIGSVNKIIIR